MNLSLSNLAGLGLGTQPLRCFTGVVNIRFFGGIGGILPGGGITATLTTFNGQVIPLIQTVPTPPGGTTLASVNGQVATVCGVFTTFQGQVVLDVRIVNPGTPTPPPINLNQILLLLLLFLILSGRFGGTLGTTFTGLGGIDLGTLQGLLAQSGISPLQLQSIAASMTPGQIQSLAAQLGVQLPGGI